jgi:spore coat polysaccharide biosynthesis predicted glycosyltransferase SpsG
MGGADAHNDSMRVVAALERVAARIAVPLCVRVVAGPANKQLPAESGTPVSTAIDAQVLRGVKDMAAEMAESDAAVSASGSSTYELVYMRVPAVAIVTADNQRPLHDKFATGDTRCLCIECPTPENLNLMTPGPARCCCCCFFFLCVCLAFSSVIL